MEAITVKEYLELLKKPKRSKFKNIPVVTEGKKFQSTKEGKRYVHLKRLEAIGGISDLRTQVKYSFVINGMKVCAYVADFVYVRHGKTIVEDVKSAHTRTLPVYRIKKKLMKAVHNIDILET